MGPVLLAALPERHWSPIWTASSRGDSGRHLRQGRKLFGGH
jgi:hypothetical protein